MHWASNYGSLAVCELLLDYGAEAGAKTTLGSTPLHIAALRANPVVCAALLARGAKSKMRAHHDAHRGRTHSYRHTRQQRYPTPSPSRGAARLCEYWLATATATGKEHNQSGERA